MSTQTVANPTSATDGLPGLLDAVTAAIRAPQSVAWDGASVVYTFIPDLTAAEATTFGDLVTLHRFSVEMSLAEWQQVKPDAAALKQYLGLSSPTNAQSVAAIRSIIRVLGVIVRS